MGISSELTASIKMNSGLKSVAALLFLVAFTEAGKKKIGEARSDDCREDQCCQDIAAFRNMGPALAEATPHLRVDLTIVADSKNVYEASYWPSTSYGTLSDYTRKRSGHLENDFTMSFDNTLEDNIVEKLFGRGIKGKYTLEMSDYDGPFVTFCFTKTNSEEEEIAEYENCRMRIDQDRIGDMDEADVDDDEEICSLYKPAGLTETTFTRGQCPPIQE